MNWETWEDPDTGEMVSYWGSQVSARTKSTYLSDVTYSPVVYKYVVYECYFNHSKIAELTSSQCSLAQAYNPPIERIKK